jgi:hypothetical protein
MARSLAILGLALISAGLTFPRDVSAQDPLDRISVSCLLFGAVPQTWSESDKGFTPLPRGYDTNEVIWGSFLRVSADVAESRKNLQIWAERKFSIPKVAMSEEYPPSLQVGYLQKEEMIYIALLDRQALFASKSLGRNPKSLTVTLKSTAQYNVSAECFFTYAGDKDDPSSPEKKSYLSIDADEQGLYTADNLRAMGSVRATCSLLDEKFQEQQELVSEIYPRVVEDQQHYAAQKWVSKPFSIASHGLELQLGYLQQENRIFASIVDKSYGHVASSATVDPEALTVGHRFRDKVGTKFQDFEVFAQCEFDYLP